MRIPGIWRETWGFPSRGIESNCKLNQYRKRGIYKVYWRYSSISMMMIWLSYRSLLLGFIDGKSVSSWYRWKLGDGWKFHRISFNFKFIVSSKRLLIPNFFILSFPISEYYMNLFSSMNDPPSIIPFKAQ
jgi:hypothetical protein